MHIIVQDYERQLCKNLVVVTAIRCKRNIAYRMAKMSPYRAVRARASAAEHLLAPSPHTDGRLKVKVSKFVPTKLFAIFPAPESSVLLALVTIHKPASNIFHRNVNKSVLEMLFNLLFGRFHHHKNILCTNFFILSRTALVIMAPREYEALENGKRAYRRQ